MTAANFLAPATFIDSDARPVVEFAHSAAAGADDKRDAALRLYAAVRDGIIYDPYLDLADPANYRASGALAKRRAFCIGKSALLAATARVAGIPARVGFADVKNHLTSPRLLAMMQTDVFIWHSYTELCLNGRWIKATPAFDRVLCERVGLEPLAFDGENDSLFHPFDRAGQRHMEYLRDRGSFADVPFDTIVTEFNSAYPHLMNGVRRAGEFRGEATAGLRG
jgi:transglutaminase-like putative cysteine protease